MPFNASYDLQGRQILWHTSRRVAIAFEVWPGDRLPSMNLLMSIELEAVRKIAFANIPVRFICFQGLLEFPQ